MSRRHLLAVAVVLSLLPSCATTLQGSPVSVFADPFSVAGMPAVDGPTGLRDNATEPTRDVEHTDGGRIDELARQSISDIEGFWEQTYGETFDNKLKTVDELISWDSTSNDDVEFCGHSTLGVANAAYCFGENTIGWDRGELLPQLRDANGDLAVTMVLAHEYGHLIQRSADIVTKKTPVLVREQQADCFAGVYLRWVAEGKSSRFTLSTSDGLNKVLAAMIGFRDPLQMVGDSDIGENEHGSAFERVSAFQFGFTDGAPSCAAIDLSEIEQRRGDLPVLLPEGDAGELPVTEASVQSIVDAMNIVFTPANPPTLSFDATACPDARSGGAASYCPATNTIVADLPALQKLGTKSEQGGVVTGDNTAYSVVVSRFMQAIEKEHGAVALNTSSAALRTACLTGVATTKMSKPIATPSGTDIQLTAGDVDEAISGLLLNGQVASDVNGDTIPSGFSRIDAFRVGVLGDADRCYKRFA